jgi:uncharacterized protein with NRDE domain
MCLIAIAYKSHADYPLLVAANRDEYYQRPTAAAEFWEEAPTLLAGRDLQGGGTWMGVTHGGRFAAITNHRNPPTTPAKPRSRGLLTLDFLLGDMSPAQYMEELAENAAAYAGFNLLVGSVESLYYYSNIERQVRSLEPGIYSLSNALLDTPWPKQEMARSRMQSVVEQDVDHPQLQAVVADRQVAADEQLPNTGVGRELERLLSAQFIVSEAYGTRATTSLWLDASGGFSWQESNYRQGGIFDASADRRFSPGARE